MADARDEFATEYCMPALKANALYLDRYPLVSALSRPVIVKHLVARRPPVRRHDRRARLHRQGQRPGPLRGRHHVAGARPDVPRARPRPRPDPRQGHRVRRRATRCPIETTKHNPFSIDQNVWGRAVETGFLEDIWNGPTKDVYTYTDDPTFPPVADEVIITFEAGRPGRARRRPGHSAAGHPGDEPPRRRPGHRPDRHRRGPPGRHQVAARSTRRPARSPSSPRTRSSRTSRSSASRPGSSAASSSAGPSWSTTASGSRR